MIVLWLGVPCSTMLLDIVANLINLVPQETQQADDTGLLDDISRFVQHSHSEKVSVIVESAMIPENFCRVFANASFLIGLMDFT
mmetsp:Transcript_15383/g.24137  ORF Transcript_15383/g.24137 Transcript_15383/m.24137 type:complete len:84 (+) Transcript_15383:1540-1791(+)